MERFDSDREAVVARARRAGIIRMLVPALDLPSARRVLELAKLHPDILAAVGVHPTEARELSAAEAEDLRSLAAQEKVAAIGEIGLDYFWVREESRRIEQQLLLRTQLEVAQGVAKPVVLHMREEGDASSGPCAAAMLRILRDWCEALRASGSPLASRPGVLHSYAGDMEMAAAAIDLGFYVGVGGPVTYPRSDARRDVVKQLPLEQLLIETDSPFQAPQLHRGQRNEPAYVVDIADRIAQIQSRRPEEVAETTTRSAARLFAWGEPV